MTPAPIVVLTPLRNEASILTRFLSVSSTFADRILVADQNSSDESVAICRSYPKVTLVANEATGYDEAGRQALLIDRARALWPGPKILLALDVDEVVAADAPASPGWADMRQAAPGTVLCFEKPDLYLDTRRCLRYEQPWPLGYVDDGTSHLGQPIHSLRLPTPPGAPRLHVPGAFVLHYALTRLEYQASKVRYYSVLENVMGTQHVWARRLLYSAQRDWTQLGRLSDSDPAWFEGWERIGIDVRAIHHQDDHWQDYEVLKLFARHGSRRFWLDDLWSFDWEACRARALERGLSDIPAAPIRRPPAAVRLAGSLLDHLYAAWLSARRLGGLARPASR